MNIEKIIEHSVLIKDDSVKVFKYKEEFIIKKKEYTKKIEKATYVEKEFLEYAKKEGVEIHQILNILQAGKYLYVVYNFIKASGDFDYIRIGENFRQLHLLNAQFNFAAENEDDISFGTGEEELEMILGEQIVSQWKKIGEKIIFEYNKAKEGLLDNIIIHGDFDFGNIIAPNIIIDTEEMKMGVAESDILTFFRMGYRYGKKEEMRQLLKGYGYNGDFEDIREYFNYKDFTVTNWLILNNKGDKERIKDIKNRIENWNTWDYKWVLYK